MNKKIIGEILIALDELTELLEHPAVEEGVADIARKMRDKISAAPQHAGELVFWFEGMGSFIDNEYFDLFCFRPRVTDVQRRRGAWVQALRKHHRWSHAFSAVAVRIAIYLKELGYKSNGIDKWLEVLSGRLKEQYRPPSRATIKTLEGNLKALRVQFPEKYSESD